MKTLQEYFASAVFLRKDKYCHLYWTSGQKKIKMKTDSLEKMQLFYAEKRYRKENKNGVDRTEIRRYLCS